MTDMERPDQMASPGGTVYTLKQGAGKHSYEGVFAPHGPEKGYHVKLRLDRNSKDQTTLPGPACSTPQDAALRLARYRAAPYEIVKHNPDRAPKGRGNENKKRALEEVFAENLEDMPAWVVSQDALA